MAAATLGTMLTLLPGCPVPPDNSNGNQNTNSNANLNSNSSANTNTNSGSGNTNTNVNDNSPAPSALTLTAIATVADSVPGQAAGATFTDFGVPVIDETGRVAFWAQYTGGAGVGGLFVRDGDTLRNVVDDDPAARGEVPGRNNADFFGRYVGRSDFDPLALPLGWGAGDRLLFGTPIAGGGDSRGYFRWRASDQNLIRIVDLEQFTQPFAARFGNAVLDWTQRGVSVSDAGLVAFGATYTLLGTNVPGQIAFGTGVFTSDGRGATVISDRFLADASVPDQPTAARYTAFGNNVAQNPAGDVFFQATYSGGNGTRGLFMARGGQSFRVIDNRANGSFAGIATGTTVGGAQTFADAVAVSNNFIVVDTALTSGGQARNAIIRWSWAQRRWTEITGENNAPADALLTGVNERGQFAFLSAGRPFLNDGSQSVRLDANLPAALSGATIRWDAGGSISRAGRVLLRYTRDPDSTVLASPGAVMWTGTQLLIVADSGANIPAADIFEIGILSLPEQDRPGRNGAINNANQAVLRVRRRGPDGQANTADDIDAIFRVSGT
ncbi:MAG: hypothetical protein SF069_00130 [Phycisphaerae bacterium]|nr:hypothetical protein [Phycisphaerae bacterium]